MRIVIDMQAVQAENRNRGIGRYSLSLALAMVRNRGEHEVLIALNGHFPDTIEPIRAAFNGLLPQENIRVWSAVSPMASINTANEWRRQSAELVREAFLASLRPDVVHVSSLFEGLVDDAVSSVGALSRTIPTAVTLYDLIPYIHRKPYLENPAVEAWYLGKIEHLRHADLWLAISESSRREGIAHLGLPDDRSVNISTDADAHFQPLKISAESEQAMRQKYGLSRPFVMYTGGIDHRKNIDGLIRAFSRLPASLRKAHQLAIVCSAQPESRHMLEQLAAQQGLSKDELVLTGFVPEDDLVALYNLCALFVFPSWHEGFGLPALESMRCGAPVIGANTSSLPEVIGWNDALFDPHSDESMASAIERALLDATFRADLVRHGKTQSAKFSWNVSAQRAIAAMERLHAERQAMPEINNIVGRRPRLAFVSPLPPEKSGIADYSAELLPELARHYEIDVIIAQDAISDPWVQANCPARSVQWFVENSDRYERVLYHLGNSTFHQHMFALLKAIPGVVVLHDFFLSGIVAHGDVYGFTPGCWSRELYGSHGYAALCDYFHAKDTADVVWKYPCSLSVIQDSLGVIAHSPNSLRLAEKWYGGESTDWAVIPLMRDFRISADKESARKALGFGTEDFLVCAFGILGPHKLNQRLLQAWLKSPLAQDKVCHLVFVGENHPGDYGQALLATIRRSGLAGNIRITGWADMEVFRQYLAAADIGVQLRTLSRGETSAAVLDCMNYGLATIVNANGSMADLEDEAVWKLPDEFSDEQLIEALETLWQDETRRHEMGEYARNLILREHNPRTCAEQYGEAIERFYQSAASGLPALPRAIADIYGRPDDDTDLIQLADAIARSFPQRNRQRQLLVDISELVQRDARSGIQRVVRSILCEWLNNPPPGYRVEPVYATVDLGYRYARRFTQGFLDCPNDALQDETMEYAPGDVFFGLDLQPQVVRAQRAFYRALRVQGVQVKFAVYDLLCVLMPQHFPQGAADGFSQWLEVVAESDGALCISKAVADELAIWVEVNGPPRERPFMIDWFHLGADVDSSAPTEAHPADADTVLDDLRSRSSFLMVGTLEPRKGHAQVLGAFEQLWQSGVNVNLVIVGKQGWLVENLVECLREHPELNKRLFWLEGISDEYLGKVYAASTCLIAASYGEGFGLPLIEAAQHKLPIIARDIPVFREVAGEHAFCFVGKKPSDLAQAITEWLQLHAICRHPTSENMPWLTWRDSTTQIFKCVTALTAPIRRQKSSDIGEGIV
ncbi:MAG TPA: glycosyltransferase [Thiobacillus sp.]|nr:glycosyltransferase [Thiobacillus sp.]